MQEGEFASTHAKGMRLTRSFADSGNRKRAKGVKRLIRNLDDVGDDELQKRANHRLQKYGDQTDSEESRLSIIEVAYEPFPIGM